MTRKISESKRKFLSDESRDWVERGVISENQRDVILDNYAIARRFPSIIILSLGMLMIGLGVLSFVAANWQAFPVLLRIVIIVGLYLSSVAAAYFLETRDKTAVSDMLIFLSGFLLLGGLALMAQIFHIEGSLDGLLGVWLLVYAPAFLIVRSLSIYILYEIVAIIYMNNLFTFMHGYVTYRKLNDVLFDPTTLFSPYQPLALLILLLGVAWWVWLDDRQELDSGEESPLLKKIFVGGSTRRIFFSNFFVINWFTWICFMNRSGNTVLPFVFGVLIIGMAISFMARKLNAYDLSWQGLLCVCAAGFTLSFRLIWKWGEWDMTESDIAAPLLSSVLLGSYLVYRIVRRERCGAFAVFFFCVLLARWYFDMFGFMSKSLYFTSGGILLLLVVYGYRRWNKMAEKKSNVLDDGRNDAISSGDDSGSDNHI